MKIKYEIIGLMSGTSLDGLDIAHVAFDRDEPNTMNYNVIHTAHYPYNEKILEKLLNLNSLSTTGILILDKEIGKFYAECVNGFISNFDISKNQISAIASHGQTIFHQPQHGFTYQIGCGSTLAFHTNIPVINDFRTKDIIAGGQGAPLVPIGDFDLFKKEAEGFLNIGGFSNVSYKNDKDIIAFDCCPGNLPLNKLASSKGIPFDAEGKLAASGTLNFFLLDLLNSIDYYGFKGPKSLGTEWLEEKFYPLLKFDKEIENNLRTVVEHISIQISNVLNDAKLNSVLVTGGGAKNTFLIERISHYFKGKLIVPDEQIIDFKEAIIFAYLGALYLEGKPNNIASVTGASRHVAGGVYHIPG